MADNMDEKESRGQERRCRKCKAHGKMNYLKNHHKKKCEYKDCDCKTCTTVTRTRERSKIILQKKRQMIKEQKLQEQRNVGEMPADFHPCLHKGMPVAINRQSPQLLLTKQQTQFHSTQFQSYVTNMTKLVARILQQTTSAENIPSNLYDVVAKTFNPSWSMAPKVSAITHGPHITTSFGDNIPQVTLFPQPIPVNPNEVRFASKWAVGLPQTCSCPRCISIMYFTLP